jgi:carnitine O-acetyltransferase
MAQLLHKLPRQPIPSLADTLDACVSSVSPMLNGLQRLKSKLVFEVYGAARAKQQERLLTLARKHPVNWCAAGLSRLWLSCRGGLPFTNNYALLLEDDPRAESLTERAARLITAALQLYDSVRTQALPPDMVDDLPLEMGQYRRCFATHRTPRPNCDEVATITGSQHIAVLVGGRLHYMVVDPARAAASLPAIQQALDHIVDQAQAHAQAEDTVAVAPGMLTALPRDEWARLRGDMLQDPNNYQTLMLLENALFVVCLDTDAAPGGLSALSANLRDGNCHNRYYDKSMQIIVTEHGKAGLCFERAAVDGSVALGFAARLQRESLALPAVDEVPPPSRPLVRMRAVDWSWSKALERRLQAAHKTIGEARDQRDIETWTVPVLGASTFKKLNISPDAAVQLALQLAGDEVTGRVPTIFEPVQIRHFAGGRMDFIMPVTAESLAAVRSLRADNANQFFVSAQIHRAAKVHQGQVAHTKSGRGLVSHLLALDAVQAEGSSHAGPGVHSWRHTVLSHLDKGLQALLRQEVLAANGSGYAGIASFGPIGPRPNMLSIGYLIQEDGITFDLRADGRFRDQARALRTALESSLLRIKRLLATCQNGEVR